jgi:hypothetical protein
MPVRIRKSAKLGGGFDSGSRMDRLMEVPAMAIWRFGG